MSYMMNKDFTAQVLAGNVSGWSIMRGFGEREAMLTPTNGCDIWRGNDAGVGGDALIPLIDSAGIQISVKSSSASDTSAGTGIRTVEVHYIKADGTAASEELTMNGTTGVNTTDTDIIHVQYMHALTVGSNGVGVGNVTAYATVGGDVYNLIALGGNMSMTMPRMVPVGHKLIVMGWDAEVATADRIAFRIRSSDNEGTLLDGVFLFKDAVYMSRAASGQLDAMFTVPAFSIVKVTAWPDQTGGECSASWWGYLVEL